ncbi:unnamed protein product [Moneuplotes crassus]|uniref:Uncharacterized protein n=1 Tax=Euplotes crassus TaxID=5936 RepID=A0AAD1XZI1_EUPCR|nr:unnamed protein product [Moneuplotes crassus]
MRWEEKSQSKKIEQPKLALPRSFYLLWLTSLTSSYCRGTVNLPEICTNVGFTLPLNKLKPHFNLRLSNQRNNFPRLNLLIILINVFEDDIPSHNFGESFL